MALVYWQFLQSLNYLHQHMQSLVSDLLKTSCESTVWLTDSGTTGITAIEIEQTDSQIILRVKISNVAIDDLEIQVKQETILIRGEQMETVDVPGYFNFQFCSGYFQSLIPLPSSVQPETVRAQLEDGFLAITLQKTRETPKQIVTFNLVSSTSTQVAS